MDGRRKSTGDRAAWISRTDEPGPSHARSGVAPGSGPAGAADPLGGVPSQPSAWLTGSWATPASCLTTYVARPMRSSIARALRALSPRPRRLPRGCCKCHNHPKRCGGRHRGYAQLEHLRRLLASLSVEDGGSRLAARTRIGCRDRTCERASAAMSSKIDPATSALPAPIHRRLHRFSPGQFQPRSKPARSTPAVMTRLTSTNRRTAPSRGGGVRATLVPVAGSYGVPFARPSGVSGCN
jgi:hypothetical protein